MEHRPLGASGLFVPILSFGTATFGGGTDFFKAWGSTQVAEATRMVRLCLDAGVTLFDTANTYSRGLSEEILGQAIKDVRNDVLISTKATFRMGDGPNNQGSSRHHLLQQCEASLKRLNVDHIDIYHMHGFDGNTPVEETLHTLEHLIQSGKVRYIACSNFSGWHLMKSLSVSERYGWNKYIAHQVYYSLANRDYEWELMPLALDQHIGAIVWSPLSSGRLSGRYGRDTPRPKDTRLEQGGSPIPDRVVNEERLYDIIDTLREIAHETEKTIPQVAINWILHRPTVANVIIGARNEEQLQQNLGAVGWSLTTEQIQRLDAISEAPPVYPYWHQRQNLMLNPIPKFY